MGERIKFMGKIAEETPEAKNCKHEWKVYEVKRWWASAGFLYCPKCGSWKEMW